jgi:ribosomal protein L16 Arg81 hydroxylase
MSSSVHAHVRSIGATAAANNNENSRLIDFGMESGAFFARHFEKNYLLLRGALQDRSFAWSNVDEALHRADPIPPYFKLFERDEVSPEAFIDEELERGVPRRRINKAKFYERLRNGATAVLNRFENASLFAERLCHSVGRFTGQPTIGNAYLSFGGQGTFGKHWDTHDVFVIQLLGTKRWQIFAPTWPLPLSTQTSSGQQHLCPAQPVMECELKPGDVLYLPRGWWHQAIPLEGGSFHLSVGTYAPTAMDFLQWALQRQVTLLQGARVGLTGDSQQALDVNGILAELGKTLRNPQELAAFHRSLIENERGYGEFDLQSLNSAELSDDTVVSLTSVHSPVFDGPNLIANGAELRLESLRRALVLHLSKAVSLTFGELCACAPAVPRAVVQAAVIDLAQHDVVVIRRST